MKNKITYDRFEINEKSPSIEFQADGLFAFLIESDAQNTHDLYIGTTPHTIGVKKISPGLNASYDNQGGLEYSGKYYLSFGSTNGVVNSGTVVITKIERAV